jgi:hypothetical protein
VTRALRWPAGALAAAFLVVLAVPGDERALALYAFLLLAGALVLTGLVALLAAAPSGEDEPLRAPAPAPDRRPGDLDAFERDVRDALARDGAVSERLVAQIRAIALARLRAGRGHGADPEAAALRAGDPLAAVLLPARRGRDRLRLGAAELALLVDQLERL